MDKNEALVKNFPKNEEAFNIGRSSCVLGFVNY